MFLIDMAFWKKRGWTLRPLSPEAKASLHQDPEQGSKLINHN